MRMVEIENGFVGAEAFDKTVRQVLRSGISGTRSCAVAMMTLHPWWIADDWLSSKSIARYRSAISRRISSLLLEADAATITDAGEWAILLTNIADNNEATGVAERITSIVAEPVEVGGEMGYPLVSTGVAVATGVHRTAADLIADARAAMSQAVENGAGQIAVFDEGLRLDFLHRCRMMTSIGPGSSLANLDLHFQPIIDIAAGEVAAVEALLRWPGQRAFGSAAQIISLAEQTNLIGRLGDWVQRTACAHARRWAGHGVVTHINVSPLQLMRGDLVSNLLNAIDNADLDPSSIAVEITESTAMEPLAIANIAAIKDAGVLIALDDFGTGYANLASLRALPFDIVKLDRSIVTGTTADSPARAMLEGIVAMSHALGLKVVAEGVETPEELHVVTETGCDLGQGFLIERPSTELGIRRLLEPGTKDAIA
ncbi:MAG: GGDEF domain-containing phosphodiesterase [Acidimicrobiia bacterium]|nr:GGDEF domain-containing phosphodiesterase [Acidimicrobiia bacterium]